MGRGESSNVATSTPRVTLISKARLLMHFFNCNAIHERGRQPFTAAAFTKIIYGIGITASQAARGLTRRKMLDDRSAVRPPCYNDLSSNPSE